MIHLTSHDAQLHPIEIQLDKRPQNIARAPSRAVCAPLSISRTSSLFNFPFSRKNFCSVRRRKWSYRRGRTRGTKFEYLASFGALAEKWILPRWVMWCTLEKNVVRHRIRGRAPRGSCAMVNLWAEGVPAGLGIIYEARFWALDGVLVVITGWGGFNIVTGDVDPSVIGA